MSRNIAQTARTLLMVTVMIASALMPMVPEAAELRDNANAMRTAVTTDVNALVIDEGDWGMYEVTLDHAPQGVLVVTPSSDNAAVTVDPAYLKFTKVNWDTPQYVYVDVDGEDDDGADTTATISHTLGGTDTNFVGAAVADVSISGVDHDTDTDGDGLHDGIDDDDDDDGVDDADDAFPADACADTDTDGDGMPDDITFGCTTTLTVDDDDDGDGFSDDDEYTCGSHRWNAAKTPTDTDGDGLCDNGVDDDDDGDGVDDADEAGDRVPLAAGFTPFRDLWKLGRPLPAIPGSIATRPFVEADTAAFLEVNNRAFDWHPEQGEMTEADFAARLAEPWFDAEGFRIWDNGNGELGGFCWTKVHTDVKPPIGEIYAIAVDPDLRGQGLGRELTLAGLGWLAGLGLRRTILYVESDNRPANRMYDELGFEHEATNRAYQRILR